MRGTIEKKFVAALGRPLGILESPLEPMARQLRTGPGPLLKKISEYKKRGIIRRYGAVLAHQRIGLRSNALVAWRVERPRITAAGRIMAGHPSVSHCYLRKSYPHWPFNLYTMIHCASRSSCMRTIQSLARAAGIREYRVLETVRELKKTKAGIWQR